MNLNFALKGKCHEMDIFVEGPNILISTFCVCAGGFLGLSKAFAFQVDLNLTGRTILHLLHVPEKSWYSTLPTNTSKAYRLDTLFVGLRTPHCSTHILNCIFVKHRF